MDYDVVVAIDIGHTHTGYAYAFTSDPNGKVYMNSQWGDNLGLQLEKTSTSLMIGQSGKLEQFGIDAEYKYSKLCGMQDTTNVFFVKKFKLQLLDQKILKHDTKVKSACTTSPKEYPALDIFSMTFSYLHERLCSDMKERGQSIPDITRTKWIVTVPTAWSNDSQDFIRDAVFKAGLIKDKGHLILLPELETIPQYCCSLSPDQFIDQNPVQDGINIGVGSKFMVIDAGGATVNICAYTVTPEGHCSHVCTPVQLKGCGAESVNQRFVLLLEQIFGGDFIQNYSEKNIDFWFQHILVMFEKKKRCIKPDGEDVLAVPITKPFEQQFGEIGKNIGDAIARFKGRGVYSKESDLIINPMAIFELLQPAFKGIKSEIESFLRSLELNNLEYVFLVGGFTESEFYRKAISASLSKYKVVVPKGPETAVLKSAIWYGLNPGETFQGRHFEEQDCQRPEEVHKRTDEIHTQDEGIPEVSSTASFSSILPKDVWDFKLVCAIDFGTTYSGYAYGSSDDIDSIILNKQWHNRLGLASHKNATSVLIDPSGEFEEFGFDAEYKYSKLCAIGDASGHNLYRHFKMLLHKDKDVSRDSLVTSTTGQERPALHIFVMALVYLKEHFLNAVKEKDGGVPSIETIRWVITVPAIWSERAKQFMREAAFQAGLVSDVQSRQLIFALEPEAAAFYCQALSMERFVGRPYGDQSLNFSVGTKYMIIDAGGGTVDITVQQVLEGGKIKELQAPSGGDWGGNKINAQFEELMITIFGHDFIQAYQMEYPDAWLELETEFERKKRANTPNGVDTISFAISRKLERFHKTKTGQDLDDVVGKFKELGVYILNDDLVINHSAVFELYHSTFSKIIPRVKTTLSSPTLKDLKYIFLVGGFAESEFLKKSIETEFKNYVVLTPENSGTAVLRGAVMFGHNSEIVSSRIARKCYGIALNVPFIEGKHDPTKKVTDENGKYFCKDVLHKYITTGEDINVGDFKEFNLHPFDKLSQRAHLKLYCTESDDVTYIDQDGVEPLAEMEVPLEDVFDGKKKEIKIKVYFGGTEILVESYDSKHETQAKRASLNCFGDSKISYAIQKYNRKI